MKKFLIFISLIFFSSIINANAQVSPNTSNNLNISQFDMLDLPIDSSNHTYKDFFDTINDLPDSEYYYYFVTIGYNSNHPNNYNIALHLIRKNINLEFSLYSTSSTSSSLTFYLGPYTNNFGKKWDFYGNNPNYVGQDVFESSYYTNFLSCYINNTNCSSGSANIYYINGNIAENSLTCSNNSDCNFDLPTDLSQYYLFLSNAPLTIKQNYNITNSNYFYKNISINNVNYELDDSFPSYYDLFPDTDSVFNNNSTLNDIFVSNIPKNNLSSLIVSFNFNYYDPLFFSDSSQDYQKYQVIYTGRINNNGYYSYESYLDCFGTLSFATNTNSKFIKSTLKNISCSSDLSSYDNIYIQIRPDKYNNISNLSLSTNYGYINSPKISNGSNYYSVMEYFDSLPSNYEILLSSNSYQQYLSFIDNTGFTYATSVNRSNNHVSPTAIDNISYGSFNNTSALVYNYYPDYSGETNLYIFFDSDSILSLGNNSTFYYVNENGAISNGSILNKYLKNISGYNTDNLFAYINDFLNDLQAEIVDVHILLEESFYSLPYLFRYFISVAYVILLTYCLFKVIRS